MDTIIVKDLSKRFKDQVALDRISFSIDQGEIFGFLGPSGAGKTTTINILTGQMKADDGEVSLLGIHPQDYKAEDYRELGIMSESVGYYERMSLYENLEFFARFHKVPMEEVDRLLKQLDLYEVRKTKAGKLSTGQRQRLFLIRAILHHPKIVFLDEPTSGMDPSLAQKVYKVLLQLKESGVTIFLTTHNMQEATKLCDRICLLFEGRIIEAGSPQEIIQGYSNSDQVHLLFKDGSEKVVSREEVREFMSPDLVSMHSVEASLESIFISLTGEGWHEE